MVVARSSSPIACSVCVCVCGLYKCTCSGKYAHYNHQPSSLCQLMGQKASEGSSDSSNRSVISVADLE